MEGFSTIIYKDKEIIYLDFSSFVDDKEKAKELIKGATLEYTKYPLHSVLVLVNVTNLRFDSEVMNIFKEEQDKSAPYEKKVAVFGMNSLQRIAYNFVTRSNGDAVRSFETELEAKNWLVED